MKRNEIILPTLEPLTLSKHNLLCWKSIFGGILISIMSYMILTALGAGIGGLTVSNMIDEETSTGLATGIGLWLGVSAVISLFLGSYFTLRISKFVTNKVGAAHGFVIASIFFILLIWGAGSSVGVFSKGIGKMVSSLGGGVTSLSANPFVQDTIHRALGNANLKSDPKDVAQGLAVRLLQGDLESAKEYYSYETGLPRAEVDAKIAQLKVDFDQQAKQAAEKAANGVADAGWSLFVTFVVGLVSAVLGGRIGAQANYGRPFAKIDVEVYEGGIPAHV